MQHTSRHTVTATHAQPTHRYFQGPGRCSGTSGSTRFCARCCKSWRPPAMGALPPHLLYITHMNWVMSHTSHMKLRHVTPARGALPPLLLYIWHDSTYMYDVTHMCDMTHDMSHMCDMTHDVTHTCDMTHDLTHMFDMTHDVTHMCDMTHPFEQPARGALWGG